LIPYSRQKLFKEDLSAVNKVLKSDFLTTGPQVELFENELKNIFSSKYATCVNSATSALHLSCMAIGLKKGDYLWTAAISFVASANCAVYCGAKVDFVDIDKETFNISLKNLSEKLKKAKKEKKLPKALAVVHMGGNPCNMIKIKKLSNKYNFKIIEDASHATGSFYKKQIIGNCKYSDICIFSFHPVKIITSGEGGAILTNDKEIYEKTQILRTHGIQKDYTKFKKKEKIGWYYEQQFLGYNYRMSDILASLGKSQLKKLESFTNYRNKIFNTYKKLLTKYDISFQRIDKNDYSSFHLVIILFKDKGIRDKVFTVMRKNKFFVNLHYIPIYRHPYYQNKKFSVSNFPNAEYYYQRALSIPVYYGLENKDLLKFERVLKKILS
jgi:UDP-4-amino-4,6-dideoxy-N-acetyl-beta-L-altrosamine transaminase